jgi:transposase
MAARKGARPVCSGCCNKRPAYDRLAARHWTFVPLWGVDVRFRYALRRVDCPRCGVVVELIPWAKGKSPTTYALSTFLARWAECLSWSEVAARFGTTWHVVFQAVRNVVTWGLAHRSLDEIRSIGVDELCWKLGQNYLTLVYQVDVGCRRLLYVAEGRTKASFEGFFDLLGPERCKRIGLVLSDMWKNYLEVAKERLSPVLQVVDRFHIAQHLSKAVDEVRRKEVSGLGLKRQGRKGHKAKHPLVGARYVMLRNRKNLSRGQRLHLKRLLKENLQSVRAYLLKESLQKLWKYKSYDWAKRYLRAWCRMAMRSRLEPMKAFVRTLRAHEREVLNWFLVRGQAALGAVEGFNNKARVSTRMAYGFKDAEHIKIALYHRLGKLPQPNWCTHRFVK